MSTRGTRTREPFNGIVKELLLCFQNARGVELLLTVQWSGYKLNNPDFESGEGKDSFLFSETSRLTLRPTHPARQSKGSQVTMLTTHLHLITERRVSGATHPSPIRLTGEYMGSFSDCNNARPNEGIPTLT
jgi:hypothetical protein